MMADSTGSPQDGILLNEIIETVHDGIIVTDTIGVIHFANRAASRITGYAHDELIGQHYAVLSAGGYPPAAIIPSIIRQLLDRGAVEHYEARYRRKDGTTLVAEVNIRAVRDAGSRITGIVAAVRDISARKNAEDRVRSSDRELEDKTARLEELNSALHALLERRDKDLQEMSQVILTNMDRMVRPHIDRIKSICRDSAIRSSLDIIEMNLKEITNPYARRLTKGPHNFTYAELQVANYIRAGKRTKEIAELMAVSVKTIDFHRKNIRQKLGIKHQKVNLLSYLESFL